MFYLDILGIVVNKILIRKVKCSETRSRIAKIPNGEKEELRVGRRRWSGYFPERWTPVTRRTIRLRREQLMFSGRWAEVLSMTSMGSTSATLTLC